MTTRSFLDRLNHLPFWTGLILALVLAIVLLWPLGLARGTGFLWLGALPLFGLAAWLTWIAAPVPRNPRIVEQPPEEAGEVEAAELESTAAPDSEPIAPQPFIPFEDVGGLIMIPLPGGRFLMGSADEELNAPGDRRALSHETPRHEVQVDDFLMAQTLVTRGLWREVMGQEPKQWSRDTNDAALPANFVSWHEALKFCNTLSQRAGLRPCYEKQGNHWTWTTAANGYRLPTEAEWEYACRAGTTGPWFCGEEPACLGAHAWYRNNARLASKPVAMRAPNPWGLHDMAGNVSEWCWDRYGAYPAAFVDNPTGPAEGSEPVVRGGSAWEDARELRSANRRRRGASDPGDRIGFRCVRVLRRQP